ncbi:hypothetical protein BC940DRAFT_302752 [Gongronella butleri]|nr:hypothetical protein BC940DRAFT_302752 [Gongronella butleri]
MGVNVAKSNKAQGKETYLHKQWRGKLYRIKRDHTSMMQKKNKRAQMGEKRKHCKEFGCLETIGELLEAAIAALVIFLVDEMDHGRVADALRAGSLLLLARRRRVARRVKAGVQRQRVMRTRNHGGRRALFQRLAVRLQDLPELVTGGIVRRYRRRVRRGLLRTGR